MDPRSYEEMVEEKDYVAALAYLNAECSRTLVRDLTKVGNSKRYIEGILLSVKAPKTDKNLKYKRFDKNHKTYYRLLLFR